LITFERNREEVLETLGEVKSPGVHQVIHQAHQPLQLLQKEEYQGSQGEEQRESPEGLGSRWAV
jgi:hypothetical protein